MFKTIRKIKRMKSKVKRYFKEIIAAVIMSAIAGTGLANAEILKVYDYSIGQYVIHGEQTLREFLGPAKKINGESFTYGYGITKDVWLSNVEDQVIDREGRYDHEFFTSEEGQNYNGLTDLMTVDEFLDRSFDVNVMSNKVIVTPIIWTNDGHRRMSIRDELYANKNAWGHLELSDNNVYLLKVYPTQWSGFAIIIYSGYDVETDSFTKYNMLVVDSMEFYSQEYGADLVVAVDLRAAVEKYDKVAEKVNRLGPRGVSANNIIDAHFLPNAKLY